MIKKTYSDKLKDPRWQKRRLEIFERDGWMCQHCGENTEMLSVHHRFYINGKLPWEYDDKMLLTLCPSCHKFETEDIPVQKEMFFENFLKAGFLSFVLGEITTTPIERFVPYPSEVFASMIAFYLSNEEAQEAVSKLFWEHLSKKSINNELPF